MEQILRMRGMAPLLLVLSLTAMSELLSACSKLNSTPSGLSFNLLENRYRRKMIFKIFDEVRRENKNRLFNTYLSRLMHDTILER